MTDPELGDRDHPTAQAGDTAVAGPSVRSTVAASLVIGLVIAVAVVAATYLLQSPGTPGSPEQGGIQPVSGPESRPLPDAEMETLDGAGTIRLADYRGSPLLLNFWATWCAPCLEEMPDFEELAGVAGDRLAVLGVNVQDDAEAARAFADDLGISYDLGVDQAGNLYNELRGLGMPTTLFVTPEGQVVYRHTGALDSERLRALVMQHLGLELP